MNATNRLPWSLCDIWKRYPSLRDTPLTRFADLDWSINSNRQSDESHRISLINLAVTDIFVHQVTDDFQSHIGSKKRKMRFSIAAVLASAIPIVTAADKQYTIKAANIEAKVSCLAKYHKESST